MKIKLDIRLAGDRITAQLTDGTVLFDDVALVALQPSNDGRQAITAIGAEARHVGQSTTVTSVISRIQFEPELVASVAKYIAYKCWSDLRPGWKGFIALATLDRVEASVSIEGYDHLSEVDRRAFSSYLPRRRQIQWSVNGEKVKQ